MTPKRQVSGTSIYFESMPYRLDESTGFVDYDMLEKTTILFRPKLIIASASAYPRDFDYPHMRKIADDVGVFLMMDMAHISGLAAASVVADPFKYCDIVTTTTHKATASEDINNHHLRPGIDYLHWRWKPHGCDVPPLDIKKFLEAMQGKTFVFIGDSILRNHGQSMVYLLSKKNLAIFIIKTDRAKRGRFSSWTPI